MIMSYQLYTDATADFCPEMAAPYAEIKVIPMELTVGEEPHTYGPGRRSHGERLSMKPSGDGKYRQHLPDQSCGL